MNIISFRWQQAAAVFALSVLMTACGGGEQAAAPAAPPTEVAVVTVRPTPLPVADVLPGRLEATQVAQVRARASGIVLERSFQEGSQVKAGDLLFRIDPEPLEAALASAEATLAKAKANLAQAQLTEQRYARLVESNAISQQDYDNAVAARALAEADVAAAQAAVRSARLNLAYTRVEAPIAGRIGRALVTVGALVGQGEATHLATIQQIDPIYANLSQSSAELLRLRRAFASGRLGQAEAEVMLIMEDGLEYPHKGKLLFSDISVDQSTGAVTLRAQFPNPDGFLLPGMYVRARLQLAVDESAIAIPQQALIRTPQGSNVLAVDDDGTVVAKPVSVSRAHGNQWVIESGLEAGDRVIVEGLQKALPGAVVNPVPWKGTVDEKTVAATGSALNN